MPWKYVYEGRNACRPCQISSACFNLEIHTRSVTSQTDPQGERRMRRVFTINRSTTKMPRECAAMGCAELQTKGSWKIAVEGSFILGDSNWKLLPCGHPHRHDFFTRGYRSRITRLLLGWSLVDGRKGLFGWNLRPCQFYKEYIQTNQRTQKYILTPWHPVQRLKGKNLFHKKPSRKRQGNEQKRKMNTQILS